MWRDHFDFPREPNLRREGPEQNYTIAIQNSSNTLKYISVSAVPVERSVLMTIK